MIPQKRSVSKVVFCDPSGLAMQQTVKIWEHWVCQGDRWTIVWGIGATVVHAGGKRTNAQWENAPMVCILDILFWHLDKYTRAQATWSNRPMRRTSTSLELQHFGVIYPLSYLGQPVEPAHACNRAGALALQGDTQRGVRGAPDQRGERARQRQPLQAGSLHSTAGHLPHGGRPPPIWVGALQSGGAGPLHHKGKGVARPGARARQALHADAGIDVTYTLELLDHLGMACPGSAAIGRCKLLVICTAC